MDARPDFRCFWKEPLGGMWLWERPPRWPLEAPPLLAAAPRVIPQVARVVDPRLEGADRGLRAWLNAQAIRGDASDAAERAPMVRDDPAAMVASHVLAAYLDAVPLGLTARLADWLTQHVATAAGRGVRARWQWEITMLAWIVEACGLPELLAASPSAAEDLLAETGFAARAMR